MLRCGNLPGGGLRRSRDFQRLLPFAQELPVLGRIDEYGDAEVDLSELASIIEESAGLLNLARRGRSAAA